MNASTEALHAAAQGSNWPERNQQWLVAAMARLRTRLQKLANEAGAELSDCADAGDPTDVVPRLIHCAHVFGLSPFERELLLLVSALELDETVRGAVATLNGGTSVRASFALALRVLVSAHWDALSPNAPLRHWNLIEVEPGAPLALAALRIDERILHFISGIAAMDARLQSVTRLIAPEMRAEEIAETIFAVQVAGAISNGQGRLVIVQNESADAAALRDCAHAALAHLEQYGLWIAAQDLPADAAEMSAIARRVDREAALTGVVPVLGVEPGSEHLATNFCARIRSSLLWLGPPASALTALPHAPRIVRFNQPSADASQARRMLAARWSALTDESDSDGSVAIALDRAGVQFHLTAAAADDVVENIRALPASERARAAWRLAREAARGGLEAVAQRIVTRVDFSDLVLPSPHLSTLRDIARHLKHRDRVLGEWGFGDKHSRGHGMTALFAGESGTGKTLAAEAIANEAGLDLYRVDLATLVSKYIGETEKNLKRLFDAAEASGAVLLFDEADALFGKRSEVKDSHDRYANIEVAYLLQRVEAYRGLAILTTNMKSALDRAFLRRIRFVVNFPFPDVTAREQIWRRQFPSRAPLGDVDFKALAKLNLPGGNINSIALNAAFKAADGDTPIDQATLMSAARAEFAKLERSMGDAAARSAG
jgi:hypothetical protein